MPWWNVLVLVAVMTHPNRGHAWKPGQKVDRRGMVVPVDHVGNEGNVVDAIHNRNADGTNLLGDDSRMWRVDRDIVAASGQPGGQVPGDNFRASAMVELDVGDEYLHR